MAQVTVNHDGVAYTVDNSVNKRAFKYDNPGGGSQRAYHLSSYKHDIDNAIYHAEFMERDTDDVNGYEGKGMSNTGVQGEVASGWITSGKLDLKKLKVDAMNKLFLSLYQIEPLNADGTVKPEFQ